MLDTRTPGWCQCNCCPEAALESSDQWQGVDLAGTDLQAQLRLDGSTTCLDEADGARHHALQCSQGPPLVLAVGSSQVPHDLIDVRIVVILQQACTSVSSGLDRLKAGRATSVCYDADLQVLSIG